MITQNSENFNNPPQKITRVSINYSRSLSSFYSRFKLSDASLTVLGNIRDRGRSFSKTEAKTNYKKLTKTESYKLLKYAKWAVKDLPEFKNFLKCHSVSYAVPVIKKYKNINNYYYSGLCTCGSSYCPVCGKVREVKKLNQLKLNLTDWVENNNGIIRELDLTVPHNFKETFVEIENKKAIALRKFWDSYTRKGKVFKLLEKLGYKCSAVARDYTYGFMNGHHPHNHIVLKCIETDLNLADIYGIEKELKNVWVSCCKKAGFTYKIDKNGIELNDSALHLGKTIKRDPDQVAEYLNKLSMELTLHSNKFSKKGNYNAFGLLKECRDIDEYIKSHKDLNKQTISELHKLIKFLLSRFAEYCQGMKRKPTVQYKHTKNHNFKVKTDSDIEDEIQKEDEENSEWVIKFNHFVSLHRKNIVGLLLDILQSENYLLFFQTLKTHKISFKLNEEFEPIKKYVESGAWKGSL